jgi:hypothetical protein
MWPDPWASLLDDRGKEDIQGFAVFREEDRRSIETWRKTMKSKTMLKSGETKTGKGSQLKMETGLAIWWGLCGLQGEGGFTL